MTNVTGDDDDEFSMHRVNDDDDDNMSNLLNSQSSRVQRSRDTVETIMQKVDRSGSIMSDTQFNRISDSGSMLSRGSETSFKRLEDTGSNLGGS